MSTLRDDLQRLSPFRRRRFLKILSSLVAAPAVPVALRFAVNDQAAGEGYAFAQEAALGTYFIEFDFRDQVDLMHVVVPPGLATHQSLIRGAVGDECSLFAPLSEITSHANRIFLTEDSAELAPHVDTIAMVDTGAAGIGDTHGHEAGNDIRSPGRLKSAMGGRQPMHGRDGASGAGNDEIWSNTPTPASLHNYYQKQVQSGLRNGFVFKGIHRSKHTVYHFAAGLPGAELDRIQTKAMLFDAFPATILPSSNTLASAAEAELLIGILKRVDGRFFSRGFAPETGVGHLTQLGEAQGLLYDANPRVVDLPLTEMEIARWGAGIPNQQCSDEAGFVIFECGMNESGEGDGAKAQVWEQFAFASKLLRADMVRTIGLEFDFMDLHGDNIRDEFALRTQAKQCARPLARLIEDLKTAGIYDRTLIAVYTADGSRTPAANSYGDTGKGTMLLAGGMIQGGYYGDIVVTGPGQNGHSYGFQPPDPVTGAPMPVQTDWRDPSLRSSSASLWKTVGKALKIPDETLDQFPDTQGAAPFDFMLRT